MLRALAVCLLAALFGCKANEESKVIAIIGAVLIDGAGGPPITDSVVVVAGSRIRSAGLRANVPIPAGSDKINGSGKFLTPGLIDLNAPIAADATQASIEKTLNAYLWNGVTSVRAIGTERDAAIAVRKAQREGLILSSRLFVGAIAGGGVAELAARQVDCIVIGVEDALAILEEARKYDIPVTARVSTLAEAQQLVNLGAAGFLGMIRDADEIEPAFLAKLRSLKLVFTPTLTEAGHGIRNTKRLADAGVAIGVGSGRGTTAAELELLVKAGLSPLDVTAAAGRNGALALRKLDELGTIEPGKRADLLLLNANPLEDVRNFQKIDQVMVGGEWVDRPALKVK